MNKIVAVIVILLMSTLSIGVGVALAAPAHINCEKVRPFKAALDLTTSEEKPVEINVKKPQLTYFSEASRGVVFRPVIQGLRENIKQLINWAAKKVGLSPTLVGAVAQAESGGNQSAVSPVGAIGVMQLMPETAAGLGVNPYNTDENILGGAQYLKNQVERFSGDITKAIAAYNAGPGAVERYNGIPPYKETRDFVARVMTLVGGSQN